MEPQARVDLCNRVLHSLVNSVVQYIDVAAPYVPPTCTGKMEALRRIRDEEVAAAHELVALIGELDGVPAVGAFPFWNVDLNYLDVRFLCRFAAEQQGRMLTELEEYGELARGDGKLRAALDRLLAQRREHLAVLEDVAATPGPKVDEARRKKAQPQEPQHVPRPVRK